MKKSLSLVLLALVLAMFTACEEGGPTPIDDQVAPTLPPAELYTLPTEELTETEQDTTTSNTTTNRVTYRNWVHAGVNLVVWNTAVVVNVAVPLAAFGRAFNETPVFIGNSTFAWTYIYREPVGQGGKVYNVVLTGKYLNSTQDVEWVLTASQVGGFNDFEWFRGIVSTDFSQGNFTINHKPNNPEPYLSIDYSNDNTDQTLRYTNVNPSNNGRGGYVEYRAESANPFNRAFDVSSGPNQGNQLLEIQWTVPGNQGRVKHPSHFNDTDWHCWNSLLQDTDC